MSLSDVDQVEDWRVSWIAEIFHQFPHIDYTFSAVNSTFDPRSNLYLESLGIIASVPGFWLILNLLAFLIFFLSRCCERDWKAKNLTCYKWTLGILVVMCCGALGLGFYGNHEAHTGVERFASAVRNINSVITSVKNETLSIEKTLEVSTKQELDRLEEMFSRKGDNATIRDLLREAVKAMRDEAHNGRQNIDGINKRIKQLDLGRIASFTEQMEIIRWPVTMTVLSVFTIFCIVLLAGIIKNSRSTLIAFTVLGLLAVILNWLFVSVYVSSCVALGDLCVEPDHFIQSQAGNVLDRSIVSYYLYCPKGTENPFTKAIDQGQGNIDNVAAKLNFIEEAAKLNYRPDDVAVIIGVLNNLRAQLKQTEEVLANVSILLECKKIHEQYDESVSAICTPALNGLAFMLLSAASAGFFFIFLIWIAAHTWIYIRKRVVCADNGRIPRGADDHLPMHGRYTPPPSYDQLSPFLPSAPFKSQ